MGLKLDQPYAYIGQSLADHIEGCLNKLEDFLRANPNYAQVVCARLRYAGVDAVEPGIIEDMLRLGVMVHDLGKAYRYYQENVEKYGGGFEGHEILSAVSCYKILEGMGGLGNREQLKILLLMAVLNHHQALRDSIPKLLMDEEDSLIKKIKHVARSGLCDSIHNLEPILNEFGMTIEHAFAKDYSEFEEILNKIRGQLVFFLRRRFNENKRWLKLYCLMTFPIILADDLDAYEKRGGSMGDWVMIKELRGVIEDE